MKKCDNCKAIIEDGLIECSECKSIIFRYCTSYDLIEIALKKTGIYFIKNEDKEKFKQEFKKYCMNHDLIINQELLNKFMPNFKSILKSILDNRKNINFPGGRT
jgi:hypothetical protein